MNSPLAAGTPNPSTAARTELQLLLGAPWVKCTRTRHSRNMMLAQEFIFDVDMFIN